MRLTIFFIFLLVLGQAGDLTAQFRVESLTVKDGLSQGYITSMLQDQRGFIWLGTFDGLNRYDGYHIKRFSARPFDQWALRSSYITCLYEDRRQMIWVGTQEGLYILDPFSERFLFLSAPLFDLPPRYINLITGSGDDDIYVSIRGKTEIDSIYVLKPEPELLHCLQNGELPTRVSDLLLLRPIPTENISLKLSPCFGDTMILSYDADERIYRLDQKKEHFQPFNPAQIPNSTAWDHNILWCGNNSGRIFRFTDPLRKSMLIPRKKWRPVFRGPSGELLLMLSYMHAFVSKRSECEVNVNLNLCEGELVVDTSLLSEFAPLTGFGSEHATCYLIDKSGILWNGTSGWGAIKINLRQQPFRGGLEGESIASLHELSDGRIWVHDYSNHEYVIDPVTLQKVPYPWRQYGPKDYYNEVFTDSKGDVWFIQPFVEEYGFFRMLHLPKGANQPIRIPVQLENPSGAPEIFLEDRKGYVWFAGNDGVLLRFDPDGKAFNTFNYAGIISPVAVSNLQSSALFQDLQGNLWVGTNRGLLHVVHPEANAPFFEFFSYNPNQPNSISANWVTSICQDPHNHDILWIGTHGGGLNSMSLSKKEFSFITESPNGFPDNVVYGVLPDENGNLWCSTNHGICCYNPLNHTFNTYQETDGLLSTEFNKRSFLRTRDGRFWFGGVRGLNVFRPELIKTGKPAPAIALTEIRTFGQPRYFNRDQQIIFAFDENNITIEFSVMDFTNTATNKYRYCLKGIDNDWVYTGTSNVANFATLAPGKYIFEVQGATADSPWSNSCKLEFTILPPWYRSSLAWLSYLLLFLGAVVGYIRYREKMIKLEHRAAANLKETERLKAFSEVKNQFFANIAHELRTPLTVITGLANRIKKENGNSATADNADHILHHSESLLHLSGQVLDLARLDSFQLELSPVQGDICAFMERQIRAILPLAVHKGVSIGASFPAEGIAMDFDPAQFQKVINNLLSNAVRHTPSGGKVEITASKQPAGFLKIQISDTGEGILPEDLPHVFDRYYQSREAGKMVGASGIGLTLSRDLIKLMHGSIAVESIPGEGATFTIFLPIKNSAEKTDKIAVIQPTVSGASALTDVIDPEPNESLPILLVVEDNAEIRAFLRLCLHEHYRVRTASSGTEGIAKALELIPDLILTDAAMPGKSGFELTAELKADERTSHIPIVMLTAKVENRNRLEAHEQGVNAFLTKPFLEEELLLVLRNMMRLQAEMKNRYGNVALRPPADFSRDTAPERETEDAFIGKILGVFENNYTDEHFNLEKLCQILNISSSQLDRKMKALTDQSPMQMLRSFRLQKARQLIRENPGITMKEVCFQTGFKSPAHFSRLFAAQFGAPPSKE